MTYSNRAPFSWYTEFSQKFMERDYLLPGQTLEQRVKLIADYAQNILQTTGDPENRERYAGYAEKLTDYLSRGWYSLSTPIWCNFGNGRGLGISCFGSYMADSLDSILEAQAEVGKLTQNGGGTSGYFGHLRGRGATITGNGKSSGAVHFMKLFETQTDIISQGSARRGHFAAYLDIDHPDVAEFLDIRSDGNTLQDISFGVCVSSDWINSMRYGDKAKQKTWARVLEVRSNIGFPYIFFTDNANDGAADVYRDKGMRINQSNMCTEIMLPNSEAETFVCDLGSMNALYFDEWRDTDAVEVLVTLLDTVMTDFIDRAGKIKYLGRAVEFARNHRALGVGTLGYHSYLQSKMVAFESMEAKMLNVQIAKTIRDKAYAASAALAQHFGEPALLKGYGRRNSTLIAIAPTTSSAFILGQVSQSIEPWNSNIFIKDLAKIKHTIRNPYLEALLESKGYNTVEVWANILKHGGSVAKLEILNFEEKAVFRTFAEISQKEIVIQAAARQKFIDQGQSLNLMIHPSTPTKDINKLMLEAHDLGIKSLYYQHSVNAAQEFSRDILNCVSCE
jgi:ribonucleoside-diphosphate reductase alpha chain